MNKSFDVLIIENEKQWQSILTEHIQQVCEEIDCKHNIETASDFIETEKKFQRKRFDLIFLDINLGEHNLREGIHFLYLNRLKILSPVFVVTVIDEKDIDLPYECRSLVKYFFNKSRMDPRQFQLAIKETMAVFRKETEIKMQPSIGDTLAANVLVEAVKFLFQDLGKRLEFWRNKKGDEEKPKHVDIVRGDTLLLKLDEVEKEIKSTTDYGKIQSSLEILKRNSSTLNTYRLEQTNPIITPDKKAFLNIEIPRLENEIEREAKRLQSLIENCLT